MDMEIWKDVDGYEGLYQVSNLGRVKSFYNGERILSPNKVDGYDNYKLTILKKPKTLKCHRLVAQAFIPNPENKPCVNHINSIRNDNRVENLEWVTHSENTLHAVSKGRQYVSKGITHPMSKINWKIVNDIRNDLTLNATQMSKKYGITRQNVHFIRKYKTWNE